jgi:hypothetical protein
MAHNNKTGSLPDFDGFRNELNELSKKYKLWLWSRDSIRLETESISCKEEKKKPTAYALVASESSTEVRYINYF